MRFHYIIATAALLSPVASPLFIAPASAQLGFPGPGVVCDQRGQVCYDSQGLSLGLTQTTFGAQAAQNVLNQIRGGPTPQDFRLSTGAACSTSARTCWSDGWSKRVVDWSLTSRLYNRSAPSGGGYPSPAVPDQASGFCTLSRPNQQLFSGACQLKKLVKNNKTRFEAALGNGQTFTFVARNGNFVIQDGSGGSWPVGFENRGTTGVFRWNNLQLIATRTSGTNGGSAAANASGSAIGNAAGAALGAGIGSLLNSLFK